MIPVLNPTNRTDQQAAVASARRTAPGLVEDYKKMIGEHGLMQFLVTFTARELFRTAEPAERFLMLAVVLGAMAEMTADN